MVRERKRKREGWGRRKGRWSLGQRRGEVKGRETVVWKNKEREREREVEEEVVERERERERERGKERKKVKEKERRRERKRQTQKNYIKTEIK